MNAAAAPGAALPPYTKDRFLGGRVTLLQPQKGHRAGLDAALLQAVVPADAQGLLIDMGAGVGTVAFAAASRAPGLNAVALERDASLAALADAALRLTENAGFAARVRVAAADAGDPDAACTAMGVAAGHADWVLMNPPFDEPGCVRPSPQAGKRRAYLAEAGLLDAWARSAAAFLKPGGILGLIHRAEALPEIIDALAGAFGGIGVRPARPAHDAPARRVIVVAKRGSRAPFTLLPGLVLHEPGGAWTAAADAVLRGEATLAAA